MSIDISFGCHLWFFSRLPWGYGVDFVLASLLMASLEQLVFPPGHLTMIQAITAASKFPNKIEDIHRISVEESRFIKFINRSLNVSRLFGIYPLLHKKNSTQLCPYLLVYNIALILGFVHATLYIAFFTSDFQDLSVINTTIRCMNMFIFVVSLILFSFRLIRRNRQIGYIFEMIESAEKRLSSLGTYFSYGFPPLFQTLLTISFWASSILVKCYYGGFKSYFHESIAYYTELLHTFNLYGFSTLLYAVKVQISNATDHLLWVMNNQVQRKRKLEVFENLVEVHEDLCSISSEISKFYSLQLLFTVTAGFISFVANAYFCVIGTGSLVNIAVYFFEALIGLFQSFMVCSSPVELANKVCTTFVNFF